ncbi:MAG: CBS domain-containing protein [Bdellovibrionales bacterium]|nr:CBS domain-containing protein [Oligoflexia bacterium]
MAVMKVRGFTSEDFAKNHPGGSLGKRLQLLVRDLMHPVPAAPVISAEASMDEVLDLSTERKLGALLVCEGSLLKGIITDGDIRRALKQKERFFQLKAGEIMTTSPTVVQETMLAYDALRLMEERVSQITVLPVVDSRGNALGLVRIHDLVQTF